MTTLTLVSKAQPMGEYVPTAIDDLKAAADFCIVYCGNNFTIRWADGKFEKVSPSKLEKLKTKHVWACDF